MKKEKLKTKPLKTASAIMAALLCVSLCVLIANVAKIAALNDKITRLNDTLNTLNDESETNEGKLRFLESDEFVEKYAREYLNLSDEDDVNYEAK
jgi:cell division protein FtsB